MGKFVIEEKESGSHFNLVAGNGQVIGTSQVYKSADGCKNGIESVRKNCNADVEDQTVEGYATLKHPKYEVYKDKADKFRFRLKASNGEIILTGQAYTTKANCLKGIESIKSNAL